ncbi:MAG: hypothetical protein AAF902_04005 [Chloroflexota bacterium]
MTQYIAIRKHKRSERPETLSLSGDGSRGDYTMTDDYSLGKAESLKSAGLKDISQFDPEDMTQQRLS